MGSAPAPRDCEPAIPESISSSFNDLRRHSRLVRGGFQFARARRRTSASTRTKNGENEALISPRETKRFAGIA